MKLYVTKRSTKFDKYFRKALEIDSKNEIFNDDYVRRLIDRLLSDRKEIAKAFLFIFLAAFVGLMKISQNQESISINGVGLNLLQIPGLLDIIVVFIAVSIFLVLQKASAMNIRYSMIWDYITESGRIAKKSPWISVLAFHEFDPCLYRIKDYFPEKDEFLDKSQNTEVLIIILRRVIGASALMWLMWSFCKIAYFAIKLSEISVYLSVFLVISSFAIIVVGLADMAERMVHTSLSGNPPAI